MNYLVDSCVWIDFFNHKKNFEVISELLINNMVNTNKIILAELIPSARKNKENDFLECLSGIEAVAQYNLFLTEPHFRKKFEIISGYLS